MMPAARVRRELLRMHLPRTRVDGFYAGPLRVLLLRRCGAKSSHSLHAGIGQVLMDQPHRHSALADGGGAPLDRAAAHITRREYARHARLQEKRLPRTFSPGVFVERRTVQLPARQDEAALVEVDGPSQPAGVGVSPDEDEEGPRTEGPACARAVVLYRDPLQAILSQELPDLGVGEQRDVLGGCKPVYEVPRHAFAQVLAPYEQVDPPRASGQEQRCLARRVAPAYDRDLLALAPQGLGLRGRVVDTHALETPQAGRHLQPAVAGPACGYHAACRDLATIGELYMVVAVLPSEAYRLLGHGGAGAELVGLHQDAAGELEAGEPRGEARVVLYPGARARLPS